MMRLTSESGGPISPRRASGGGHAAPMVVRSEALSTYRFDRRREARNATTGWAQVLCMSPMRTFLGGAMTLVDVSEHGTGVECERALEIGEPVEVRLSPFRVRGRFGTVVRCEAVGATKNEGGKKDRYRIAIRYAGARAA